MRTLIWTLAAATLLASAGNAAAAVTRSDAPVRISADEEYCWKLYCKKKGDKEFCCCGTFSCEEAAEKEKRRKEALGFICHIKKCRK